MIRSLILCLLLSITLCAKQKYDVLSLSSAIVDHCFLVSDEELLSITKDKGGWAPIDYPVLQAVLEKNYTRKKMATGGSGVNVMKGLAHFGHTCAVIGKIGSDDIGSYFSNVMQQMGIFSFLEQGPLPTGQALCFITPDGERTFRTYLGASHSLGDININNNLLRDIKVFHIEGYQLVDRGLFSKALRIANEHGVTVSVDLANAQIVKDNKDYILSILPSIDILFCNEVEAKELTGLPAELAVSALAKSCKIAIVTMSEKGCWTQSGSERFHTIACPADAVDTTAAGDLFAAGFLHGYLSKYPLRKCSYFGSLTASNVVKVIGTDIPEHLWTMILQEDQASKLIK